MYPSLIASSILRAKRLASVKCFAQSGQFWAFWVVLRSPFKNLLGNIIWCYSIILCNIIVEFAKSNQLSEDSTFLS